MKFSLTHKELKAAERSVYSQGGQDGVLEAIFNQIGHGRKLFVDIGARDGLEISNTANLRFKYGWSGILLDATPLSENVKKLFVNKENVNEIELLSLADLLCIDIDGNDYWIWKEIIHRPRVVCVEYNSKFRNDENYSIEYNPTHQWDGDDYYGASLSAFKKLGEEKYYTLVYVIDRFDAIFIRNELIEKNYTPSTLHELLPEPIIAHEKISNKKWVFV